MALATGVAAALASMVFCGVAPLLYKKGLEGYSGVLEANFVRCLYAVPASLVLLLAVSPVLHVSAETAALIVAVALLTSIVADTALLCSVKLVGAGLAMALAYTSPSFTVPLALAVGEEVSVLGAVGAALVACGVAIALYAKPTEQGRQRGYVAGVLAALAASLSYAIALAVAVIAYKEGVTPVELTFYRNIVPVLLLTPWAPRSKTSYFSGGAAFMALGGVLGSVLAVYTYYQAMACLGMIIAATIPGAAPVLTLLLASLLLKEKLTRRQIVGAALAVTGALLASIG